MPQGHHGHGLLASGLRGLKTLFPAHRARPARRRRRAGRRHRQHPLVPARPLQGEVRERARRRAAEPAAARSARCAGACMRLPNVRIVDHSRVIGLLRRDHGRVRRRSRAAAGRGAVDRDRRSRRRRRRPRLRASPEWLESLGYARPAVEEVNVGIGYTTRIFRRLPRDLDGDMGAILAPKPPQREAHRVHARDGGQPLDRVARRLARQPRADRSRRLPRVRAHAGASGHLRRHQARGAADARRDVRVSIEPAPALRDG